MINTKIEGWDEMSGGGGLSVGDYSLQLEVGSLHRAWISPIRFKQNKPAENGKLILFKWSRRDSNPRPNMV